MPVNPQPCLMCSHCVFASESKPVQRGELRVQPSSNINCHFQGMLLLKQSQLWATSPSAIIFSQLFMRAHFTSSSYMLKASSTVFLAFAPFSHFVYAASLRCSVIKQCVLERTHRQREEHKHPRERWCERQILWHPALSFYDSSINKWRPPPSPWKWAQRGQMPLIQRIITWLCNSAQ